MLIKSKSQRIFGAYAAENISESFLNCDNNSFLFSLDKNTKHNVVIGK